MPDGDRVHKGLGWRYQEAYKQVCDGQFGGDTLADEVVSAVGKDIQYAGDPIIQFLQKVGEQSQQILDRRMFEDIDWQKELAQVDRLAQPIYASKRFKALAVEACKEQLQDLRHGGNPSNCYIDLLQKYMWNAYYAQFFERVPLTPSHHQGVSEEFVGERLALMRPYVQGRLQQYAKQVYSQGTVAQLPRRRSTMKRNYNADTDLSTVGA
jgi:hypothetical protein